MIHVIWYDQCRGNWDHGTLLSTFEKYPGVFPQHNSKELLYVDRAIIIVSGKPEIVPLRNYLETFESGVVVLTSEEDSYFDWEAAIPPHLEIWTQYYHSPSKDGIKTRLLLGAPYRIKDFKITKHLSKKYLWSFVGQVQNPFRQECVEVLNDMLQGKYGEELSNGYLQIISMFGGYCEDGMEYQEYLDLMSQSRYVICPAGSMCVDSFRVYEAMECGAIPITDMKSPRDKIVDWWDQVYPRSEITRLNGWRHLPEIIEDYERNAKAFSNENGWWIQYKMELEEKLIGLTL